MHARTPTGWRSGQECGMQITSKSPAKLFSLSLSHHSLRLEGFDQSEGCVLSRGTKKYQTFTALLLLFLPSLPLLTPFSSLSFCSVLSSLLYPSFSPPPQWYDGFDAGTTEGLLVVGVGDYLTCFWPDLTELHSLYESLEASIRAARKEGVRERGKYRVCV